MWVDIWGRWVIKGNEKLGRRREWFNLHPVTLNFPHLDMMKKNMKTYFILLSYRFFVGYFAFALA